MTRRTAVTDEPRDVRFWRSVAKTQEGCWEWQGRRGAKGYGVFVWDTGKPVLAHRASYTIARGSIPAGLFVCHHCDNPKCVRPDHLFVGTNADNMKDGYTKGRVRPPVGKGGWHSMTPEQRAAQYRTHCVHGHEYNAENTYICNRGERKVRVCRTCSLARAKARPRRRVENPKVPSSRTNFGRFASRGAAAANAKRKANPYCNKGHLFTPENTRIDKHKDSPKGVRRCMTCRAEWLRQNT
jgi:hypothetical protein